MVSGPLYQHGKNKQSDQKASLTPVYLHQVT